MALGGVGAGGAIRSTTFGVSVQFVMHSWYSMRKDTEKQILYVNTVLLTELWVRLDPWAEL